MPVVRRAAVVGGGIGGLAAALCLAARGISVRIYEQAPAFTEVGAGLQIGANGVRVLRALGLEDAVLSRATVPDRLVMRDGRSGGAIARVPFGAAAHARYGAPYLQIHRADLLSVLAEAAAKRGVGMSLGARVSADALPEADLVVGADGVRSGIRTALVPGAVPLFTGHVAWRALVPSAALQSPPPNETRLFMGAGRHLVLYPLRNSSLLNIVAVEERPGEAAEGWMQPGDPAILRAAFSGWCEEVAEVLSTLETVHRWGLFGHPPLPRWHDGRRVVLLGDACHPMLPYLAQGAVMALEDAWALSAALDAGPDLPSALSAYERVRKPRATRVQSKAAANGRLYHAAPGPRRMILRSGLRLLSALPGHRLLAHFDWLYGHRP